MTRRMLLTLIAILTGLSWQASGVQARSMMAPAHVSAVTALATVQQAKVSAVAARPAHPVQQRAVIEAPLVSLAIAAPTVRTRIDRARE
jgi:hypothetical protein